MIGVRQLRYLSAALVIPQHISGNWRTRPVSPQIHGFVTETAAALEQRIFDVTRDR